MTTQSHSYFISYEKMVNSELMNHAHNLDLDQLIAKQAIATCNYLKFYINSILHSSLKIKIKKKKCVTYYLFVLANVHFDTIVQVLKNHLIQFYR